MSWGPIPELLAIGLLTFAFLSITRPGRSDMTRLWLAGWVCIELHFCSEMFADLPNALGQLFTVVSLSALTWAAQLFVRSLRPDLGSPGGRMLFWGNGLVYTAYLALQSVPGMPAWSFVVVASLFGVLPLAHLATHRGDVAHPVRRMSVGLSCLLAIVLLGLQFGPHGDDVMSVAPLTAAYLGCCINFWYAYRRSSGGFVVTGIGFLLWTSVFLLGTLFDELLPSVKIESEVWNLPKYLVAVGMILLLLEDQIKQNQHMAQHDLVTGLPNRRLFEDRLGLALERARRAGTRMSVLAIDLDRFKEINDTLGHHVGDIVLQQIATMFSKRLRQVDTIARIGGDEFAVVLEGPAGAAEARSVADELARLLAEPLSILDHAIPVGASIGIATFPEDGKDLEALCIRADQRMYEAKRQARRTAEPEALAAFGT